MRRSCLKLRASSFKLAIALSPEITAAAEVLRQTSSGLMITAGAGMGVDSGLPDFRGNEGFWRAYPPIAKLGIRFEQMANPRWFQDDPSLAWGFYGHRLNLYRRTKPHHGFTILKSWAKQMKQTPFVFTSNVDGQFQRASFTETQIDECHGSIHHLQCSRTCTDAIWSSEGLEVQVDENEMRALDPLPRCPHCGETARPNILLFGDWHWNPDRNQVQQEYERAWLERLDGPPVIIECGAGTHVPSVRHFSEELVHQYEARLIRINPREAQVPRDQIGIALGALEALTQIEHLLSAGENPGK